ncbi:tetratricopeptide repeat protein [Streptomyces botrytidirepellens]|uniref:Tetratricopeptide repeat protein n=1 Tax=Streptomyces botrytidirepellens TaxID=2486417 RepID=A0A3M8X5G3_9ACTN|nr:tetratricopeptide repeat protein [Streptomyces botrytidirepellens]RNG37357.1 tetratricopeptide repeat protein [Streptomyces botrytidirepellens]
MTALDDLYRRFPDSVSRLYRRLGFLPTPVVTSHTAAVVLDVARDVATQNLELLVRANVLKQTRPGFDFYRFSPYVHNHPREVGEEDEPEQEQEAPRRVLDWYLATAARAREQLTDQTLGYAHTVAPSQDLVPQFTSLSGALTWQSDHQENLQRVIEDAAAHGWHQATWQLVDANAPGLHRLCRFRLSTTLHELGLYSAQRIGTQQGVCRMLSSGAEALAHTGEIDRALDWYRSLGEAARAAGDVFAEGRHQLGLAVCHRQAGDLEAAESCLADVLELWGGHEHRHEQPRALAELGRIFLLHGDWRQALAILEAARHNFLTLADAHGVAKTLTLTGLGHSMAGNHAAAQAEFHHAMGIFRDYEDVYWQTLTREFLAKSADDDGDDQTAAHHREQAQKNYPLCGLTPAPTVHDRLRHAP